MTLLQEIESIIGREVEFEQVTFNGQQGHLPIYFNHNSRNFVSSVFAETQEEAASKFLQFLKTVKQGDINEQSRDSSNDGDSSKDSGPTQS